MASLVCRLCKVNAPSVPKWDCPAQSDNRRSLNRTRTNVQTSMPFEGKVKTKACYNSGEVCVCSKPSSSQGVCMLQWIFGSVGVLILIIVGYYVGWHNGWKYGYREGWRKETQEKQRHSK